VNVKIDADLCTACELCTSEVPEVFQMGDEVAEVVQPDVPADLQEDVQQAADDCPVEAIIVE
jgi:ferredoxin